MSENTLIKVQDLKKEFVNDEVVTKVLHGLSFEIKAGEFLAIMGPSGSGKSTLMHILGFLDVLTSGIFLFKGRDVSHLNDDELAKIRNAEIGFVFQAFNLLPRTTVYDNVRLPLLYSKEKDYDKLVKKAIEAVDLSHRANNFSNQLSGGEKQRVAIARALVHRPKIIVADEPTGNLDSINTAEIVSILSKINEFGTTVLLVTHNREIVNHLRRRVVTLNNGEIINDDREGKYRL